MTMTSSRRHIMIVQHCVIWFALFATTKATCNNEQQQRCRKAAADNALDTLPGGGECRVQQYVQFTHVCDVTNYLPSVDYCCCAHAPSILCCRYHQDWSYFRCVQADDTVDVVVSRWPSITVVVACVVAGVVVMLASVTCCVCRCWCRRHHTAALWRHHCCDLCNYEIEKSSAPPGVHDCNYDETRTTFIHSHARVSSNATCRTGIEPCSRRLDTTTHHCQPGRRWHELHSDAVQSGRCSAGAAIGSRGLEPSCPPSLTDYSLPKECGTERLPGFCRCSSDANGSCCHRSRLIAAPLACSNQRPGSCVCACVVDRNNVGRSIGLASPTTNHYPTPEANTTAVDIRETSTNNGTLKTNSYCSTVSPTAPNTAASSGIGRTSGVHTSDTFGMAGGDRTCPSCGLAVVAPPSYEESIDHDVTLHECGDVMSDVDCDSTTKLASQ